MSAESAGSVGAVTESKRDLEVRLLGTFDVRVNGQPLPPLRSRKEQWLLALLILRQDRETARDWLAATFWPENDESQGLFYLRKALSNLRKALGPEAYRLQSPTIRTLRLDLSGALIDVLAFDDALARPLQTDAHAAAAVEALELYRGPLLQECLEEWAWLTAEREARAQRWLSALEAVADRALARGEAPAATRWLRRAMAADPYRESAARSLMQALADSGDPSAVRQVYGELRARLWENLNAVPAGETDALYKRLSEARPQKEPPAEMPASAPPTRRHLPVPLTDLLGRESAVAEVGIGLLRARLLTLLGPGGVGKTRLAIAAADAVLPRFPDGAWFVDLAALSDPAYVAETAARALALPEEPGISAEERLIAALRSKTLLVVLDNCEHLLGSCADLSDRLLRACPDLRILATSREALGISGEQVYPVPTLALPPPADTGEEPGSARSLLAEKNPAFLREYAGIELFVQRASQAAPAFRLDRRNAAAVCEICWRLDGIPLAIELAAARVRSLSVGEIAARLSDRFRLLTRGSRSALPRQQTLRALIDWSYDLLTDREKSLLSRLSVFAGDWTLSAAENVCAGGDLQFDDVLDSLAALVEKSLAAHRLSPGAGPGEARYSLLETIRQYAGSRLAEAGNVSAYRRQHADFFLALVEGAPPSRSGPDQARWLDRLESDHDNLRQAMAFYEEDGDGAQKGLRLVTALSDYWIRRDHLDEARQRCRALLARDANAAPTPERAKALMVAGNLAFCQGDNAAARRRYEESRDIRVLIGDRAGLAGALGSLGNVTQQQGDYAAARSYFEQTLALSRESGNLAWQSNALTCLGSVTFDQGDYNACRAYNEAALEVCRLQGGGENESIILNTLGMVASRQSLTEEALRFHEQALAIDRGLGRRNQEAISLFNVATACRDLGNDASAAGLYSEALSLKNEGGDVRNIASMLETLAGFLAERVPVSVAACRMLGAAEKLREENEAPCPPLDQEIVDASLARVRQSLSPSGFSAAWAEGRARTTEEAIADAIRETDSARQLFLKS